MIRRAVLLLAGVCLWTASNSPVWASDDAAVGLELFEKKIRPVLVEHCYSCHAQGAKIVRAGLLVDSRQGLRGGGDSGPAIVPGKPEESLLLEALRYESYEMPPAGKLPDEVIADFERWIQLGAPDPRETAAPVADKGYTDLQTGATFWAYRPVRAGEVPTVADAAWPASDIDRYILARQESAGVRPVADADRAALARRLYFDLIGLPPTPDQIDAFVSDTRPDARERLVDHLLEMPEFGQRWARHWLDVARYADSSGGGREIMFDNAWRYRDYVVDSLNRDKPLDTFITEQIAGDLLPFDTPEQGAEQLIATGFLVLGPLNYETQDKVLLRMDTVDEQLDVISRGLLGMTVTCARCHDHKFDPIPTSDYYALAGIFRSTQTLIDSNVSNFIERPLPGHEQQAERYAEYQTELKKLETRLRSAKQQLQNGPMAMMMAMQLNLEGIVIDNGQAELTGTWTESTSVPRFVGDNYLHDGDSEKGRKSALFRPNLPRAGRYEVRMSYNAAGGRADNLPVLIQHAEGTTTVTVDQRRRPPIDRTFLSLGEYTFKAGTQAAVTISNRGTRGHVIVDAVQFIPRDEALAAAPPDDPATAEAARQAEIARLHTDLQAKVDALDDELAAWKRQAPTAPPMCMSVRDYQGEESGDCAVHIRGNVRNLGYVVPRGFMTVTALAAGNAPEPAAIAAGASGRLELAEWLTDPGNPLVSRVLVNRVWHWLLGAGMVRTCDNFGATGELPSHPELLDHLAAEFVADGWSLKRLVRRIVLSRTYRLSSNYDAAAYAADPENRLFWQAHRRRLEAEQLRDAMLLASGQLDPQAGGPTIRPGTKSELGYTYDGHRRSLYVPVFRNALYDYFDAFDFANPNTVVGVRNTSVLATQALFMMNSPQVMDLARATAERLLAGGASDDASRVDYAFRLLLGRPPNATERRAALDYLRAQPGTATSDSAGAQADAWTRLVHALFASVDFRYVN